MIETDTIDRLPADAACLVRRVLDGRETPGALIRNGMVHSDIYTSQEIFNLEIERIFHRSWVFLGHGSEIPSPGDFKLRTIGRTPIIFVRGQDGAVRALVNRCRHRGAAVCEVEQGNARNFRCWYHGWVFRNTGELIDVPGEDAYPSLDKEAFGLTEAPRIDSYRDFYFVSLSPDGPPLPDFLGRAKAMIDMAIDVSPTGQIVVDAGSHKTTFRANWKLVGMDGYHTNVLHASVFDNVRQRVGNYADPFDDNSLSLTRDLGNGHVMLDLNAHNIQQVDGRVAKLRQLPGGEEYIADMMAAYGEERGTELIAIGGDPHLGVFPNLQLIGSHVRIIIPISADRTEVMMLPTRMAGVADEINVARLRAHESFYGPAGAGSPDDAEIFERVQNGLRGKIMPWINLQRGMGRERVEPDGSVVAKISDELTQRAQLDAWSDAMRGEAA